MAKRKISIDEQTPIDGGTPFEITVTGRDRRPAWKRMYQNKNLGDTSDYYNGNALADVVGFVPGVGDAIDAVKAADAVKNKDYVNAAFLGGSLLLPNLIEKPAKALLRPLRNAYKRQLEKFGQYAREHVYVNVAPLGYDHPVERAKNVAKGILSGKRADIENPKWLNDYIWHDNDYGVPVEYFKQARIDAWRLYNRLPQKYNTFIPSNTRLGAYQPNLKAIDDNKNIHDVINNNIISNAISGGGIDIVNGSGGNVGKISFEDFYGDIDLAIAKNTPYAGVMKYEDVWDLHPFSRPTDGFTNKVIRPFTLKLANDVSQRLNNIGGRLYERIATDPKKTKAFRKAIKKGDTDALEAFFDGGSDRVLQNVWEPRGKIAVKVKNKFKNAAAKVLEQEEKITSGRRFKKLDERMKRFEVGQLTGGRPFTVVTEIPFHKPGGLELVTDRHGNKYLDGARFRFGFDKDAIVTPKQKQWINNIGLGLHYE